MLDELDPRERALARLRSSRRDIVVAIQELHAPTDANHDGEPDASGWGRWLSLARNLVHHAPWWPTLSRLVEHALAGSPASVGLLLASRSVISPARRAVRQHPWLVMGAAAAAGVLLFGQRRRLWRLGLAFALPRMVSKARQVGHMLATEALTHWFERSGAPQEPDAPETALPAAPGPVRV